MRFATVSATCARSPTRPSVRPPWSAVPGDFSERRAPPARADAPFGPGLRPACAGVLGFARLAHAASAPECRCASPQCRPLALARRRALRCALPGPLCRAISLSVERHLRARTRPSGLGCAPLAQASLDSSVSLTRPPHRSADALRHSVGHLRSLADAPFGPWLRPSRSRYRSQAVDDAHPRRVPRRQRRRDETDQECRTCLRQYCFFAHEEDGEE